MKVNYKEEQQILLQEKIYTNLQQLIKLQFQASGFSLLPRQPVSSLLVGRQASKLRGRGLNFEEVRHYLPGDDIRHMDWKVTARTKKPHIRVYTEERERQVLLVIDQRISMFFGSREYMKSVVAAQLAALLSWRVVKDGDQIGGLVFNDTDITEIRPRRSKNAVMRLLKRVHQNNHLLEAGSGNNHNPSMLDETLKRVDRLVSHDYLVAVISDFSGTDDKTLYWLTHIARHNDLLAFQVYDPLEVTLPWAGKLVVSDGDLQLEVDSHKKQVHSRFTEAFNGHIERIKEELTKHEVPVIPMNTVEPVVQQVRKQLGNYPVTRKKQ